MSQQISIASKPVARKDLLWRRDGEEDQIIILSKEGAALPFILNPMAARIFDLCDSNNTIEDMAKTLCAESTAEDYKMVLDDVLKQVRYFLEKEIVEV